MNKDLSVLRDCFKFTTPLNPLVHPVKILPSIFVYEIISSPIRRIPYFFGHPLVDVTSISVSFSEIELPKDVSEIRLSFVYALLSLYTSRFDARSTGPPINSWEM